MAPVTDGHVRGRQPHFFRLARCVRLSKTGHQRALIRIDPPDPRRSCSEPAMLISRSSSVGMRNQHVGCRFSTVVRFAGAVLQRDISYSGDAARVPAPVAGKGPLAPASPRREASLKTCPR
jgi:hypothetical protein